MSDTAYALRFWGLILTVLLAVYAGLAVFAYWMF